jgi:hypothetical protein
VSFTPKPWTFAGMSESGLPCVEFGDKYGDTWHIELLDVSRDDAHLITAAPDMYDVLNDCVGLLKLAGQQDLASRAEAALAKARNGNAL